MIVAEGAINANRHRDPRKQLAGSLGPAVLPGQKGAGGVASSMIATADVGAVGLCSGANPPARGAHAIVAGHHARPGGGRKPQLGSLLSAAAILGRIGRLRAAPSPG
jgi:hypothetical protein